MHQAIEAKEGVRIQEENVTLATITLQNYFRLYEKLAGMTGTAKTEEKEFVEIYGLNVVEIPTNVPVVREDNNDLIFKTKDAKFDAVIEDIAERNEAGQPVLVGTIDVETSEHLAQRLQRRGVPHNVLNAKQHEREAEIIKDAGEIGAVTIATNMAGRGVDIKLAEGVRELGGLYVLGTERHEARRIDNQLRGRSGRQGDPGESRYYLSGQDQVVRLFAGDRIYNIMERFKLPDDEPMEASILSKQIESAQKKVEEQNFVMRKNVLKYDDVLNVQRQVIYEQRRRVLEGDDLSEDVKGWIDEVIERLVAEYTAEEYVEEWDIAELVKALNDMLRTDITEEEIREDIPELTREALVDDFAETAQEEYADRAKAWGDDVARHVERYVVLQVVDQRWREHLENMDYLREGVHLRAMAQKDPLVEYRHEGHLMFEELGQLIRSEVVSLLFHAEVTPGDADALQEEMQGFEEDGDGYAYEHQSLAGSEAIAAAGATATVGAATAGQSRPARSAAGAARWRPSSASVPSSTRSDATTRVPAARARSTRSATAPSPRAAGAAARFAERLATFQPGSPSAYAVGSWRVVRAASGSRRRDRSPADGFRWTKFGLATVRHTGAGRCRGPAPRLVRGYHHAAMAETTQTVEERLQGIGTQLAWVREYL